MERKHKTNKFISALIIILIIMPTILLSNPKKAEAIPVFDVPNTVISGFNALFSGTTAGASVTDVGLSIKDWAKEIGKELLRASARRLLAEMTTSTINWINSGFHGQPLFLENPDSFFRDVAKSEIRGFIDTVGYNRLGLPFGRQWALQEINNYKSTFERNAQYSLSRVINDPAYLKSYRNDFNTGGWNAFFMNTQYPQNNYLGFQIMAKEEIARKIRNQTNKVEDALDQGRGFLSQQACPSNPDYNNDINPYNRPSFRFDYNVPEPDYDEGESEEFNNQLYQDWVDAGKAAEAVAQARWNLENVCPGGLQTTTPGAVVSSKITKALNLSEDQASMGAAFGNSLSAIFDSMFNKLIGDGLTKLATKVNPRPVSEEWSYEGQTLGVEEGGSNVAWNSGPDQVINIEGFKKQLSGKTIIKDENGTILREEVGNTGEGEYVSGDIANTESELRLMDNASVNEPGIMQLLGQIWPKVQELDMCIPGPDLGWEKRLVDEQNRNSQKLQEKVNDSDGNKAAEAQLVYNELKFAVDFFKDWINNQMLVELPGSVLYMDAVDEIETLDQQANELIDNKRAKSQTLARLKSIDVALGAFTTQPEPDSAEAKALVSLKKQYDALRNSISNTFSIEDTRNELAIAKEKVIRLDSLNTQCGAERTVKGWSNPGGRNSTLSNEGTEQELFCDLPIKGGANHETFTHDNDGGGGLLGGIIPGVGIVKGVVGLAPNPLGIVGGIADRLIGRTGNGPITHPEIPYVNAEEVLKWRGRLGVFGHSASVKISCNIIYPANVLDYKGNIPGTTNAPAPESLPDDTGEIGSNDNTDIGLE